MRQLATLLILGTLAAACGTATADAERVDQQISLVPPAAALQVIDEQPADLVVLDIRTPEEFAGPRLADSVNVDFYAADFTDQLDDLDKTATYVVYCRSGNRTSQAIPIMRDLGFQVVYEVDGGIVNWANAGFPLEQ